MSDQAQPYLSQDLLDKMDAYFRAANYLSIGQIYLYDNPLMRRPLSQEDVKPNLMGHWGTSPGQNFIYVHLNRIINKYDLDMFYISGPGHGGPAVLANTYMEGTYSEVYPKITEDEAGLKRLFKQFSFPGGVPSHVSPECPGSIHEGGELGYSLSHAFGAVLDNPDLIAACVVGDGEAETGPLANSWHLNKFLNPKNDGVVLPILHLNSYKISNPTLFARISREELVELFQGYGWTPYFVEGDEPAAMHNLMAETLDKVVADIKRIHQAARGEPADLTRPRWPMIILDSPKGWTGPKKIDGLDNEDTYRSHQVPFIDLKTNPQHFDEFVEWLSSYRPDELFDADGKLVSELKDLAPKGGRRMSANAHTNGGTLLKDLILPQVADYAAKPSQRGEESEGATRVFARYLRDLIKANDVNKNFRLFGPDEVMSNGLGAVFEVTNRQWLADKKPNDEYHEPEGRVIEVLSEHLCEGWLEGYLLTGRHGLFTSYEAFVHIVSSMFNQHAKWLDITSKLPWRADIASLNYLITSHVWRQGHNGFTHQDPGFLDHIYVKKADLVRAYLPPDANTLLCVMDTCFRSRQKLNIVVAGKHPMPEWFSMEEAERHCQKGIGQLDWASNDEGDPDVVLACAGDVPTLETLAAVSLLREHAPAVKIRVVNVVDLMTLRPSTNHPSGLTTEEYVELFTNNKPVVFMFHGYSSLIHRLAYRRPNHDQMSVYGYMEEGTTTTPFDMTVLNAIDRFHIVQYVLRTLDDKGASNQQLIDLMDDKLATHRQYVNDRGEDMPEIKNWRWQ